MPGDFLAVRPLNWDEIRDKENNDDNRADPRAPSCGRRHSSNGNGNDERDGEEETQVGVKGTGKRKGTKDGKRKWKRKVTEGGNGKRKGNGKGKGIVKQIPGVDDISPAVVVPLKKEMYATDSDMES
jgi:hypothetical protein